jgi:hypothetical protein
MGRRQVTIAAFRGRQQAAKGLRQALLQLWRSSGITADVDCLDLPSAATPDQLVEVIRPMDAVIALIDDDPPMRDVLSLVDVAEQAGTPIVTLVGDLKGATGRFAGALTLTSAMPAEAVFAAIEGLFHAGTEAKQLRAELSLSQRCSGGLEGEILRMHEELQLAAMIQRELLPRELPEVHGVTFGTLWRPANYVSGDIFDVCRLDEDHVGVFLTDAVGHGVPAALMTMVISRSLMMREPVGDSYRISPAFGGAHTAEY